MTVQEEIENLVARMLLAIDVLDWHGVGAALSSRVRIDYTSLFGGNEETLASDSLLQQWCNLLPGFDATQHLTGPVTVTRHEGPLATAETQVRAYHFIAGAEGGAVWMVAGRYRFAIEETDGVCRIAGITLQLAYQDGNLALPGIAQARAAAGQGRASQGDRAGPQEPRDGAPPPI